MAGSGSIHKLIASSLLLVAGLCLPVIAVCQPFVASFNLHTSNAKVYLLSYYGEKTTVVDSAVTSSEGEASFIMGTKREPGIYRISLNRQKFVDFIYNHENVSINMDLANPGGIPKASESRENKVFYQFLEYEMKYRRKLNVFLVTGVEYPEKDEYYKYSAKEYKKVVKDRNATLEKLIAENKGRFVARVLMLYREPEFEWDVDEQERRNQLRIHYFDHFTLTDSALIRTNLLTSKAIDYLTLYTGPNMSQSEVENQFIKGVDVILAQLEKTPVVYEFMLSYLVGGFEKYKMEKVLVHLYEKYLSGDHCAGDVKQDELSRRLKAYEQLAIGKTAPELASKDADGNTITLAGRDKDYYLLVFYASWCPHCHDLLSSLPELKQQFLQLKLDVITLTLDTARTAWLDYLAKNKMSWINSFEGGGWNAPTVKAYNIYATPTMFLVDRQRKIIAKPITFTELKEELKRLMK
ncbi:MAG: thioredoxin-like domain-containing protein [Bacteroidales bacterium]